MIEMRIKKVKGPLGSPSQTLFSHYHWITRKDSHTESQRCESFVFTAGYLDRDNRDMTTGRPLNGDFDLGGRQKTRIMH